LGLPQREALVLRTSITVQGNRYLEVNHIWLLNFQVQQQSVFPVTGHHNDLNGLTTYDSAYPSHRLVCWSLGPDNETRPVDRST